VGIGPNGELSLGPGTGRGAWLCGGSPTCVTRALRGPALERALRAPVRTEARDALVALLGGNGSVGAPHHGEGARR